MAVLGRFAATVTSHRKNESDGMEVSATNTKRQAVDKNREVNKNGVAGVIFRELVTEYRLIAVILQ